MDRRPPAMRPEADEGRQRAEDAGPPSIDAATAERIRKALTNPRPPSPAAEAFARVDARIAEYKSKRGL
jgi:hypothetical protein